MSATTEPLSPAAPQPHEPFTPREWLDALSTGTCDPDTFSRAMIDYFQFAPDGSWEVVSLLDQYHRLGKIESTLFQLLKSRFQYVALGADSSGAWRAPPPLIQDKPAAAAVPETQSLSPIDMPNPDSDQRHPGAVELLRGRYRLGRLMERDAVGSVYEAADLDRLDLSQLSRRIAIKVLRKAVSGRADSYNELRREFQYLQSLSHPGILRVHEFDRDGDMVFFSMELLSGLALSAVLSSRNHVPLRRPYAAAIIRQIGDAIAYAHRRGIVHGALQPRNIFLTDEGEIRVLGFGASPAVASDQQLSDAQSAYAGCPVLEGCHSEVCDDVYAIACLACTLLSGYHPFDDRSALEARELRLKPRRPPGLTYRQWNALRPGLSFDRERRPSDIPTWLQQVFRRQRVERLPSLSLLLTSARPRQRFLAIPAMILLIAAGAALGAWALLHFESPTGVVGIFDGEVRRLATVTDSLRTRMSHALHPSAAGGSAVSLPTPPPEPAAVAATAPVSTPSPTNTESVAPSEAHAPTASAPPAQAPISPPAPADYSPSRIELAFETTEVANGNPTALVLVRRRGNLLRDATFTWWTETGTAKAGADFEAFEPRTETLRAGKDRLELQIPIVSDSMRRQTKNFFVVIDQPGPHVSLGPRTVAKVSILAPD